MNSQRLAIAILVSGFLAFCGCDGDGPSNSVNDEVKLPLGTLQVKLGESMYDYSSVRATWDVTKQQIRIRGDLDGRSLTFNEINIILRSPLEVRDYPIDDTAEAGEAYVYIMTTSNSGAWPTIADSGTVRVSRLNDTSVAGTFNFRAPHAAYLYPLQGSDGEFHASVQKL